MTSQEAKTQLDALLANNTTGDITAEDLRSVTDTLLRRSGGVAIYEDSTKPTTSVTPNTWTLLPIDGLGAGTKETALPHYVTSPLVSSSKISLAELDDYQTIHSRVAMTVTTTTANQVVHLRGNGYLPNLTKVATFSFSDHFFKTAGSYEVTPHFMTYNTPDLSGGTLDLEIFSESALSVVFDSILIRIAG